MKRKQYKTIINAPRERVWEELWGKGSYEEWTSAFSEGSKVETDWNEGGKILFLNAENEGMVARIEVKKEPEKMVFRHLGMVDKNGKEDLESEQVKAWSGAEEIYLLKEIDNKTELVVQLDLDEGHVAFFDGAWPKAFEKLRSLAEADKQESKRISVSTVVKAPLQKVWLYWTEPEHITQWNQANADWHCPAAENDIRENGKFSYRMEARDGSNGFDFEGIYDRVVPYRNISYILGDGRKVDIHFKEREGSVQIDETFEAEKTFPLEMQRTGWQTILENFREHVEHN